MIDTEFGVQLAGIDPDRPIFEQVAVDSMQLVSIAASIEREFKVELPLSLMEQPTVRNLVRMISEGVKG